MSYLKPLLVRAAGAFMAASPAVRRLLIIPMVLGLAMGFATLHFGAASAAAQSNLVTVTCTTTAPSTCTVTLNASVAAGSSFTATLANGSTVTINCPSGCAAGSQYTVTMQNSGTVVPQYSYPTTQYNYPAPQYGPVAGQCVNSVPTAIGCTSLPYVPYTPAVYSQPYVPYYPAYFNGCAGFGFAGCGGPCFGFNQVCTFNNRCFRVRVGFDRDRDDFLRIC